MWTLCRNPSNYIFFTSSYSNLRPSPNKGEGRVGKSQTSHQFLPKTSIVQILGLIIILMSSYLVVTQFAAILNGQTQYERKHAIGTYDLGWKYNVMDVLGRNWWLVWLFPTLPSPLLGDGLRFEYEDVKKI